MPDAAPVTMALAMTHVHFLSVPILPICPVLHSSPTACSTRTPRRDGGARCSGVYSPLVGGAPRASGWRIEQMPCPELAFTGLHRFWAVKEQLDTSAYRRHCRRHRRGRRPARSRCTSSRGDDVILVGIEGSPSMGVHITSSDPDRGGRPEWPDGAEELSPGSGIFIEELTAELAERGITAPRSDGHLAPAARLTIRAAERAAAGRADGRLSGRRRTRRSASRWSPASCVNPDADSVDALAVLERERLGRDPAARRRLPRRGRRRRCSSRWPSRPRSSCATATRWRWWGRVTGWTTALERCGVPAPPADRAGERRRAAGVPDRDRRLTTDRWDVPTGR